MYVLVGNVSMKWRVVYCCHGAAAEALIVTRVECYRLLGVFLFFRD